MNALPPVCTYNCRSEPWKVDVWVKRLGKKVICQNKELLNFGTLSLNFLIKNFSRGGTIKIFFMKFCPTCAATANRMTNNHYSPHNKKSIGAVLCDIGRQPCWRLAFTSVINAKLDSSVAISNFALGV